MINVFIDSNILYEDYFFENKSNNTLLEFCKEGTINIFMSEIVKLELRRQYEKEISEYLRQFNRLNKNSERLKINIKSPEFSKIEEYLDIFDSFYNDLNGNDNFHYLNFENEFLGDIVDRAINRKKPFTEQKTELKDAIIWKTYSKFVEDKNLEDCIFLTNNTNDFCVKNDKKKIHPDLEKDTTRFSVLNSSFEFIKINGTKLDSPEYRFQAYIEHFSLDDAYVYTAITEYFEKNVFDAISLKVDRLHPSEIFSGNDYYFDGYLQDYNSEIIECNNVDYEIIDDKALISGILLASSNVDVLEYNFAKDFGEDSYVSTGEHIFQFKIFFNFDFYEGESFKDFEITNIDLISVD